MRLSKEKHTVLEYKLKKFDIGVPTSALDALEIKKKSQNDFKMSEAIRIQTGINKIEEVSFQDQVEQKTLEKLKEVQEGAYQEAYQLGLEEGRKEAFKKMSAEIEQRLQSFDNVLTSVTQLKSELFAQNEAHLVKLAFYIGERLAFTEAQSNQEVIVEAMRSAIAKAQGEEEITAQVAPEQFEFLELLKKETSREFEFIKKVKLVPVEGVSPGGCVIETNYGEIDARFEERVKKLWEGIADQLHRIKAKITAA